MIVTARYTAGKLHLAHCCLCYGRKEAPGEDRDWGNIMPYPHPRRYQGATTRVRWMRAITFSPPRLLLNDSTAVMLHERGA
jgi:hypothetical protein